MADEEEELLNEDIDDDLRSFEQDELVKKALADGVDLRQYATQVDEELRQVERESIMDYIEEAEELASLHTQIRQCDSILDNMETMLSGFQGDLANISAEIKHLQDESISMNIRLRNRRAVEGQLSEFITQAVIPPQLVTNICAAEVNEAYIEYVVELNSKVRFAKQEKAQRTRAYREIHASVDKLRTKAAQRMRDFLLQKIGALKKRMTNVQILQQAVLLKFKTFYAFLLEHAPDKAGEVLDAYNTTMSSIFHRLFKAHVGELARLAVDAAAKTDVVGEEAESVASLFAKSAARGEAPFKLGDRAEVLDKSYTPIIPAIVYSTKQVVHFEAVWASTMTMLVDTACSEHAFCHDFFGPQHAVFENVHGRTLNQLASVLEDFLGTTYDTIGCLLLVRVSRRHQGVMGSRNVGGLKAFFEHVLKVCWERFFATVEHQHASLVKTAQPPPATLEVHPLPVVRRYAELAASLQLLAADGVEQRVISAMSTLRSALHAMLVTRYGGVLRAQRKLQAVFLINNADAAAAILREHGAVAEDLRMFEELLEANKAVFVEEVLDAQFGKVIRFVKQTEQPLAHGGVAAVRETAEYKQLEAVVKEFHASWKRGIEAINVEVMKSFANFKNGMEILKQALTQLLLYHTRFLELVKKLFPEGAPFAKFVISISTIMNEIKLYSRNF